MSIGNSNHVQQQLIVDPVNVFQQDQNIEVDVGSQEVTETNQHNLLNVDNVANGSQEIGFNDGLENSQLNDLHNATSDKFEDLLSAKRNYLIICFPYFV